MYYSIDDAKLWDEATPQVLSYVREVARTLGPGFDAAGLPLGDAVAGNPPMVLLLKFAPGGILSRHSHDCYRVELLLQGTLITHEGVILHPGSVMTSGPNEFYGPHTAGPEGAVTAEVFSKAFADIAYDLGANPADEATKKTLALANQKMTAAREAALAAG